MNTLSPHADNGNPYEKQCSTCKQWKPANNDHFPFAKKDGTLYAICKDCRRIQWQLKHPGSTPRGNKPSRIGIPEGYKCCNKCKRVLALNEENWHRRNEVESGFTGHCKECRNAAQRKAPDAPEGYKRCTICKNIYEATTEFFARHSMGKGGLRSRCKTCTGEKHKEYSSQLEVKERIRVYGQEHRNLPEVKKHRYEHSIVYRKRPEVNAQLRINKHNRRALEKNAEGTYTPQQIQEQYQRQKGKCHYCKVKVGDRYHVDHVVPLTRGGSNDISNLVIACAPCNLSKNNRLPHEWIKGGRLL